MKKIALLLAVILTTVISPISVQADENKGYLKSLIEKESYVSDNNISVQWDNDEKTPRFIEGKLSSQPVSTEKEALKYLEENLDAFNLNVGSFKLLKVEKDSLGYTHYKYQYEIEGIRVYGSDIILHTDKNNFVCDINGLLESDVPNEEYSKKFKLNNDNLTNEALDFIKKDRDSLKENDITKVIYNYKEKWQPCYLVNVVGDDYNYNIFIDSINGQALEMINNMHSENVSGSGMGQDGKARELNVNKQGNKYYLEDISTTGRISTYDANNASDVKLANTLPGKLIVSDTPNFNEERQEAAIDAHYYVVKTNDYFKKNFNRKGFDNLGGTLKVSVHYGSNEVNAYFNGRDTLFFGDGDNVMATNFAKSYDIVAHEFTHGVTKNSADLEYRGESGALNESFSDVFGCIIEEKNDWIIGEDVALPNNRFDLRRSLKDPTLYKQPANMKDYYQTSKDNGGVHTNSGIPNKAFYNIMTSVGVEKASAIYYRALTTYMNRKSVFIDARMALEKSAIQLYGAEEKWAVGKGFYDVGIGNNPGENPGKNPDDDLKLKEATLTIDNQVNDGNFNLSILVPGKTSAKTVKLIENDKVILDQKIDSSNSDVKINKEIKGKTPGEYIYLVEVSDGNQTLVSKLKVVVEKNTPPTPNTGNEINTNFDIISDWGTGANFNLTITNNSSKALKEWNIEFSFDKKINSIWDGKLTSLGNNRYRIEGSEWNNIIDAKKSVVIGGSLEGNSKGQNIYNISVNGVAIDSTKIAPVGLNKLKPLSSNIVE
ncbi:M4 family metallopeptidase [Clostridium gasigenes]|uniref:Zn-dependent metalloprotease n=1 Tax=Clostridium gasigenes TaxID=94869 RepID=A0A1H0UMA7_9CLOT|nr:M4 family metallopeptidase [Clostridium gasigenes]SDP66976.1 Zn-dependent metalloprotease [Clostridium gasigenes]